MKQYYSYSEYRLNTGMFKQVLELYEANTDDSKPSAQL